MTPQPPTPAFRMPRLLWAAVVALVAAAAPASALLGLPIGLPSTEQHVDTAAGSVDAYSDGQSLDACYDVATPALPAVPALPALPVPVAVPAAPALPSAGSASCIEAGLDGVYADIGIDAAGTQVGTGLDARSPVPAEDLDATASDATGFFESLMDRILGWI